MGFDALWISPILKNYGPNSYHGYWISDFYALNERFGTEQDLKDLVAAAHARGRQFLFLIYKNFVQRNVYNGGYGREPCWTR